MCKALWWRNTGILKGLKRGQCGESAGIEGVWGKWAGEERRPDLVGLVGCAVDFSLCRYFKQG